jgi:mono/diheme cytochrome c family protein
MRKALALAIATTLCGCGEAGGSQLQSGSALFRESCTACHSLFGNDSLRREGGDLLGFHFSRQVWLQYAREMPVRPRLTPAQLETVVDYIMAVQHRG